MATIAGYLLTALTDIRSAPSNPVLVVAGAVYVTALSFGIGLPVALPVSFASTLVLRRVAPIGHRIARRLRHHDLAEPVARS